MKNWVLLLFVVILAGAGFISCGGGSGDGDGADPANEIPDIYSLTADPESVEAGQATVLTCTAGDLDGDVLTYTWAASDGAISGSGSSVTWTAPATVGTYTLTCAVSDGTDTVSEGVSIAVYETPVPGAMVPVQGGAFDMTDYSYDQSGETVTVTVGDFSIGKYEVTQKEWFDVMGVNPASGSGTGDNFPVYHLSWFDILVYCNTRSLQEGLTPCYRIAGSTDPDAWPVVPVYSTDPSFAAWNAVECDWTADGYRLPTEAEWVYAAGGAAEWTDAYAYSGSDVLGDVAWYQDNSTDSTHAIGTKSPNQLGIHDMSGNLYEFCWDWYAPYTDNATDPTGPASGDMRMVKGGSWMSIPENCVVFGRFREYPNSVFDYNGFRVVRKP